MQVIATPNAPAAVGPYSQAISANGFVFVSGQLPIDPQTGELSQGSVAEQTRLVADNIAAILEEAGSGLDKVVKTTCFLADLSDFAAFNGEYANHFTSKPARECVQAASLPKGARMEVSVIALA